MARDDPWDELDEEDLDFIDEVWHHVFGTSPPHYDTARYAEISKKVYLIDSESPLAFAHIFNV